MSDTTDLANHNRLALECSPGSGILDGGSLNDLVDIAGVFEKRLQDSESAAVRDTALVASVEYLSVADGKQLDCWTYKLSLTKVV